MCINLTPEKDALKSWIETVGIPDNLPDIRKEIASAYAIFDRLLNDICPNTPDGVKLTDNMLDDFVRAWLERQMKLAYKGVYMCSGEYQKLGFLSQEGKK